MEGIFTPPDPNVEYECDPYTKSRGFTLLMKMVLLTKEYPELNNTIKEYIINNKEELNKQNERGWTALMLVCQNIRTKSSEETLRVLIDAACDLNLKNINLCTALMISCMYSGTNSTENTVKMLIDAGCNLDLQDNYGCTALMLACKYSSKNTVKMLIDAGCDLDLQDKYGWTALMDSCRYSGTDNTENTVKMLIDAGCDLDLQDNVGWTALMMACGNSSENIVKMLIDAACNLNIINNDELTELILSCRNKSTTKILLSQIKFIAVTDHIKKINYLNVIKHIPKLINDFKFKYGQLGQKIVTYHIQSKFKSKKELYEEIKLKDSKILDYLDIHSEEQLNKLEEYVYCT